jgi:hypothetical protein
VTRNGRGGLFTCVFVDHFVETLWTSHAGEVLKIGVVEARVEWTWERLTSCDQCPPSPPAIPLAVLAVFLLRVFLDIGFHDLLHVANLDQDILGLQIGVDDATLAVQVVEAKQNLLCDLLDEGHGDAAVIPSLD